jgi:DNA-binding response OmpR family regulator
VWGLDYDGESNVVDTYVHYLRRKIDDGAERQLIRTVRGYGYALGGE